MNHVILEIPVDTNIHALVDLYGEFHNKDVKRHHEVLEKFDLTTLTEFAEWQHKNGSQYPFMVVLGIFLENVLSSSSTVDIEDHSPSTVPSHDELVSIINNEIQAPDTVLLEWLGIKSGFYLTKEMEAIIGKVALYCSVLAEKGSLDSNGSNVLLSGVKGVGKTTLMKFMYFWVKKYLKKFLCPIFIDFSSDKTSPLAALKQRYLMNADINKAMNLLAFTLHRPLIFFGDEIDALYQRDAPVDHWGVKIVSELYSIGKANNAFAVISGSSAKTAALAFKDPLRIGYPAESLSNYSDLNYSVYQDERLFPLRTREQLNIFVDTRKLDSPPDIDHLFHYTGGVMRYMQNYLLNFKNMEEKLATTKNQKLREALLQEPKLATVFILLAREWVAIQNANPNASFLDNPPQIPDNLDNNADVYSWIERSLVFKTMTKSLEYLFPWHYDFLMSHTELQDMDTLTMPSFSLLIQGLPGGGPGDCAERYVVN